MLTVPMTDAEFDAYVAETVPAYAQDNVAAGRWTAEEALGRARADFDALLPQGLATANHFLWTGRDPETENTVGTVWFAVQEQGSRKSLYVYDIAVHPPYRRRGYATQFFRFLEDEARGRGVSGIGLHVFGHNTGAQALYAKLGYQPTSIHMFKKIGSEPQSSGD